MFNRFYAAAAIGVAASFFLFLSPKAFASSRDAESQQRQAEVSKFVADRLHVWQDRMNLNDWDIRVEVVRADHLEPRTLGNIHWDTDVKKATIGVLSPLDYQLPYNAMLADMEVTIVHELVHLELASLPRSDASRRVEERAVNEIAAALLRLARH
jgi:hypothetical protein